MKDEAVQKKIVDLRDCLYRILDGPQQSIKAIAQIAQEISIDDKTAEAFAKSGKNVIIIQAAQNQLELNSQVAIDSAKALKYLDGIEGHLTNDLWELEKILESLFRKGWKLSAIEEYILEKAYQMAEDSTNTKTAAAKKLGIKRTTLIERKKKHKKSDGCDE